MKSIELIIPCLLVFIIFILIFYSSIIINRILRMLLVDSLTITTESVKDVVTVNTADNTIQVSKLKLRWDYILMYIFLRFLQGGGVGK